MLIYLTCDLGVDELVSMVTFRVLFVTNVFETVVKHMKAPLKI